MKTRTRFFCLLLLSATHLVGVSLCKPHPVLPTANKCTATKEVFTCFGRYASYFNTLMPFDNDPCNHTPSNKAFC